MNPSDNFTNKLIGAFNLHGTKKVVLKGTNILIEGEIEKHIYLIESGAVRVYYLTELQEKVIRVGYKGSIINSLSSFLKQTPSEFFVEAIRKTVLQVIDKSVFTKLVTSDAESTQQYIHLLETLITQQIDREIDLLVTSPTERLERVLHRSPHLFQEIPLKYIASYLRMQPETLSRIRKS
ncbi:MAG: Crp/Fnr family transcriptional regulator [Deinococcales bacterium]|nr:Crp/Fnr family transcriptional regulator [Chitinophagaceae bacterium]